MATKFSKNIKFKMDNIEFNINIDNSLVLHKDERPPLKQKLLIDLHFHPTHEIFFIPDSPFTIYTKSKVYEFKNRVVIIPPFKYHSTFGNDVYRILLSYKTLGDTPSDFAQSLLDILSKKHIHAFNSTEFQFDCCQRLNDLLYLPANQLNSEMFTVFLKTLFFDLYLSQSKKTTIRKFNASESYLIQLENLIHLGYNQDINLEYIANLLHLSPKQVSRIIQKNFKMPLSALLTKKRLDIACILLSTTDEPITHIIEKINFNSESYFFSQFKKAFHCTPSEYRKRNLTTP